MHQKPFFEKKRLFLFFLVGYFRTRLYCSKSIELINAIKRMKKLLGIVFLGVAMVVASAAWAQDMAGQKVKLTPQQRAEKLTQVMSRQLLLSPEQVEKVQAINLKYAEKNELVKRDMAALKANAEAKNAEMKAVLNPAQYEKLLKMEERTKQKIRERIKDKKVPIDENQPSNISSNK